MISRLRGGTHPLIMAVAVFATLNLSCGIPAEPTRPANVAQAATAIALTQAAPATPTPRATVAPVPTREFRPRVEGRLVVGRDTTIDVIEAGISRTVFEAAAGGNVKEPRFSSNGQQVIFAYAPPRPDLPADAPLTDQLIYSDILVADLGSRTHRVAVAHDRPGTVLETPIWAPDGGSIVYAYYSPMYEERRLVGQISEIRRSFPDGRTDTVAPDGLYPALTPSGSHLVYVHESMADGLSIRVRELATGSEHVLVAAARFQAVRSPVVSPDGTVVAFGGAGAAPEARSIPPIARLTSLLISFVEAHGLPWEIWTIPVSGGAMRQITQFSEDSPGCAWSRDGTHLLCLGGGGLYRVRADGSATEAVLDHGGHGGLDWRWFA